jgi:serine/threonine protein kinase
MAATARAADTDSSIVQRNLMLQAKQRVGEYVLDAPMGQTAYAETWTAHHHVWAEELAIVKVPTDASYLTNLRKEGVRVHRLMHPSIGRPVGFDPLAEPPYLITQYQGGVSLRSFAGGKKLSVARAMNILRHLLGGLQYAHEHGVVHADVRPDNILVDPAHAARDFASPESVQLIDFGIGQAATATFTADANGKSGSVAGLLAYVAPEQLEGAAPDIKSDMYSVGVVLFEMLTGERPSGAELPSEIAPGVPKALDDAFRKSYARRERRFESAKSFLGALAQVGGSGSTISPASPAPVQATAAPPANPPAPKAGGAPPTPGIARPVSLPPKAYGNAQVIGFRSEEDEPAPTKPSPTGSPNSLADTPVAGNEISLAPSDDDIPVASGEAPAAEGAFEDEPSGLGPNEGLPTEAEQEEIAADDDRGGVEVSEGHAGGSNEPVLPVIPRVPSKADTDAMFDELAKRQVRTPEEVRTALKSYHELRDLDEGEAINIRLRLIKWANSMAGGQSELDDQITVTSAAARPYYVVKLVLRTTRGDEPARTQVLDHPIAELAASSILSADYRLIAHLSAIMVPENMLESIASAPLRAGAMNMVREARREFFGRIMREDLLIFRANIITASYRFDDQKYRVFMVGNTLSVVSAGEPFTRIRQEPTKRAATLLNGDQIFKGISELRRGLEDRRWETKSIVILSALRGKLAAAYVAVARETFNEFGWLESLEDNAKAGQLVPGHEEALEHASLVRKRITQVQLVPGLLIATIFIGMALTWMAQMRPFVPKLAILQLIQTPFIAAGVGALVATLWSWNVLRLRLARTDFTFYQALLLPTAVAGVIAFFPQKYSNLTTDIICGLLLVLVIVADVLIFKKLGRYLFRRVDDTTFTGDGITATNKIENVLRDDWERLKLHYLQLGPLYSYTSATARAAGHVPDLMKSAAEVEGGADAAEESETEETSSGARVGGSRVTARNTPLSPEVEALASQMDARINAALRNIGPAARMLMAIVGEYSKSVAQHQIGMMQGNATKIEQKGKDLAAKLADFDRLCKSPLSLNADADQLHALSERLAERANDPEIRLLQQFAERAKTFRSDETNAIAELNAMLPAVQEVVENLKRG